MLRFSSEGLSIAQVRVVFRLPEDFGSFSEPLAYVQWFTALGSIAPDIGMHQVSHSTRMHRRRASIIPIAQIQRTIHLIPKFGREVNSDWTAENVLEKCEKFYVNPYFRHLDFVLFRYLA